MQIPREGPHNALGCRTVPDMHKSEHYLRWDPRKIEKYNGPYFVALNNINSNLGSTRGEVESGRSEGAFDAFEKPVSRS
jgi:hypothetical protein